jgi:hypothetical protein
MTIFSSHLMFSDYSFSSSDSGDLGDMVDSLIRVARVDSVKAREAAMAKEEQARGEEREEDGIELANIRRVNAPEEGGLELANLRHSPAGIFPPKNSSPVIKSPGSTMSSPKNSPSPTKSTASNAVSSPLATQQSPKTATSNQASDASSLLTSEDHKSILDVLMKANAIKKTHYEALVRLLTVGDRRISEIFARYETTKDVPELIARLSSAASMLADILKEDEESDEAEDEERASSDDSNQSSRDGDENDEDDDDEQEEEEDGEELDDDDRDTVESMFFGVVQRMQLNHLETTALRLAIARDDPSIRKCLETFRRTRNESDLMTSLRAISRDTISSTLQEAGFEGVKSPSKQEVEAEADARRWINSRDDDDDDDEDAGDDANNEDDDSGDNSSTTGSNEDEDEESDEEDEEGEEGGASQANRERVFPFLVSELSKDNIISAEDARTLYKLFLEKNDVLYSALDVYDLDNNIGELVDTMMNLAKLNR